MTEYPSALIVEAADDLEAKFIRLERATTRDGEPRAIAVLELMKIHAGEHEIDGAERSLWLHETALRGQFQRLAPKAGELVRIKKGAEMKASESTGRDYWPFEVTAPERQPEALAWDDALLGGGSPAVEQEPTTAVAAAPIAGDDRTPF
jgi:hypothetical protein